MSLNSALNATVALIEGRTQLAKEILRGPGSDVKNVPKILARLDHAVSKASAQTLRTALRRTLAAQPRPMAQNEESEEYAKYEEGFYEGVAFVEAVIESIAEQLE